MRDYPLGPLAQGLVAATFLGVAACQPTQNIDATIGADVTIYTAANIITLQGPDDVAQAVAVEDGKIAAVGELAALQTMYPAARLDEDFADKTLVPGLIDPHTHIVLGGMMYAQPFAPPWPMATPEGMMAGYPDRESFLTRLGDIVAAAADDGSPIVVYGYHNLVHGDLVRADLDAITTDRPLIVWHYSGHDFYFNSTGLDFIGATPAMADQYHGVDLAPDGSLTGRIYEHAALVVFAQLEDILRTDAVIDRGLQTYFNIVRRNGITTKAELGYGLFGRGFENETIARNWSAEAPDFRLYLVPEFRSMAREFGETAPAAVGELVAGTIAAPAPVLPRVKFFTDAAFYSQTMRLSPPGYLAGQSVGTQGLWVLEPDAIAPTLTAYTDAGFSVHIHSNGDAAQSATLDALEDMRSRGFEGDFVIEHGGLFSPQQVTRAGDLGAMASIASHYVYYLSGAYAAPLGPARAQWISPVGALTEAGVPIALHSDAPLAPPQPLRAAGAHITRMTREGTPYATDQALVPYEALEAITLDAARVLGLDDQLGSITPGKRADFTVLDQNPLALAGADWPSIGIWGVVIDGDKRPIE